MQAKRLKHINYRQPLKNCSENAIPEISPHNATCKYVGVIGLFFRRPKNFAIPEKQNTLCQCRKNANFERIISPTAAAMQRPIRFAMDPQRECDFFFKAKRLNSRKCCQPLQNPSENANFKNQRNA